MTNNDIQSFLKIIFPVLLLATTSQLWNLYDLVLDMKNMVAVLKTKQDLVHISVSIAGACVEKKKGWVQGYSISKDQV